MTFSICVREQVDPADEPEYHRYGVAVTTRRPGVGIRCPFVSDSGALSTQSASKPELGRKAMRYLDDGISIENALEALINADDRKGRRQVHGVGTYGTFAFSGEDCWDWYGHVVGHNYTVAGNVLVGRAVLEETAAAYERSDTTEPLPERLIESLAAGYDAGGDKRDRRIQSAACRIRTNRATETVPFTHDLRADATETPIEDLRRACELAREGDREQAEREGDDAR